MVNIDVLKVLNEYYTALKKSCGTFGRNELYRICLLPLLKDITDGPLTPYVTDTDAQIIDKYMKECFSYAIASKRGGGSPCTPVSSNQVYCGTSNSYPSNNVILNSSSAHSVTESSFVSPFVDHNYFWIAMPKNYALNRVDNKNFAGDYFPVRDFGTFETALNDIDYTVYYCKSLIPLNATYVISINRN